MRVALINVTASGGTGRFCVELCRQAAERGHTVLFCHARSHCPGDIPSCRVGWYSGTFAGLRQFFGSIGKHMGRFFSLAARSLRLHREEKKNLRSVRLEENDNGADMVSPVAVSAGEKKQEKEHRSNSSGLLTAGRRRIRRKVLRARKKPLDKGKVTMRRVIHPKTEFIRSNINTYSHGFRARLTDRQGFFSKQATRRLVMQLREFQPDVIHLHNLHGYYLHMPMLFDYLREEELPVVWTLNDLWAVTGHCAFPSTAEEPFLTEAQEQQLLSGQGNAEKEKSVSKCLLREGCRRWQEGCGNCVMKHEYPKSWLMDQSARNWREKRSLFGGHPYMLLTVPSLWMQEQVQQSFLGGYTTYCMPHGLDVNAFRPCVDVDERIALLKRLKLWEMRSKYLVVSVSDLWEPRKGLEDLMDLKEALGKDYCVVAVGLDEEQRAAVPKDSIISLEAFGNTADLCNLYTSADLVVCLSRAEAMATRPLQAMACGTQVLTWDVTSMPEVVTEEVGLTAEYRNISDAAEKVRFLCDNPRSPEDCRKKAMEYEAGYRNRQFVYLYEGMHENGPRA